jgi:transcriptional regulator with XRE-family HTH domain
MIQPEISTLSASELKIKSMNPLASAPCLTARRRIAKFFRDKRLEGGLTIEQTAQSLGFAGTSEILAYESAEVAIPLDEIFTLTNILNIPPEDVLALIHDAYCDENLISESAKGQR